MAESLRARLIREVDSRSEELIALSHSLHVEPELGHAEHRSRDKILRLARAAGFEVRTPVAGLETAFAARAGKGDLVLGFCAEYDALPDIGHGCGHNVNGAAAVGAALAVATVAEDLGVTVVLLGTPAEETDGGKVRMLEAGVFDDVAAAMMVHAGGEDEVGLSSYALVGWEVEYFGRSAHAATPWLGTNAADAVAIAYQAVGLLRQQLPADVVVSFVITEAGRATNVVPDRARATLELRATTVMALDDLQGRVRHCLEAGALASGTRLRVRTCGSPFADLRQDPGLTGAYVRALQDLGRSPRIGAGEPRASTDMGNVSHALPSLHPIIGYDVGGAAHHTREFARHGTSASADRAVLDGAKALALVAEEIATDPRERDRLVRRAGRIAPTPRARLGG